jgi:hypothetical protein
MTFKEQLSLKADKFKIKEDVAYIKKRMEEFYAKREFTISLIRAHGHLAIGGANSNRTSLFVPIGISPEEYLKLFVEAFKNLGFTSDDIIITYTDNEYFESYDIILKW